MSKSPITVCVVDDDAFARQGMAEYVSAQPDFALAGVYATAAEAIDAIIAKPPDVVLMDLRLPGMGGRAAARALIDAGVPSRVLAITSFDDEDTAARILSDGCAGYVVKSHGPALASNIRAAHEGAVVLPPDIARRLGMTHSDLRARRLDARDRQVLEGLADGLTNLQIARSLHLSLTTVKNHLVILRRKLNVTSRAKLVAAAERYRDED